MSFKSENDFGLSCEDYRQYQQVFAHFPQVQQVVIYGSRAKGNYRASSDIDLTIINSLDWQTFTEVEMVLDELMLPYKVDLSLFTQIDNPDLIDHIERVGKCFYEKI